MYKGEFKKLFSRVISEQFDIDKKTSKVLGESIIQIIMSSLVDSLVSGKGFSIRGFGSMTVKERKSIKRYNPYAKEHYLTSPINRAKFKCSNKFRERMGK